MRIAKESNIQEELKEEKSKTANLQREIDRLRATPNQMPGRKWSFCSCYLIVGLDSKMWILFWIFGIYAKYTHYIPYKTIDRKSQYLEFGASSTC